MRIRRPRSLARWQRGTDRNPRRGERALTRLVDIAEASVQIASTAARSAKTKQLAALLRAADTEDVPTIVAWLSGELLQRRIGVGFAALWPSPRPRRLLRSRSLP